VSAGLGPLYLHGNSGRAEVQAASPSPAVASLVKSALPHPNERDSLKGFPPNIALHWSHQPPTSFLFTGLGASELRR